MAPNAIGELFIKLTLFLKVTLGYVKGIVV